MEKDAKELESFIESEAYDELDATGEFWKCSSTLSCLHV